MSPIRWVVLYGALVATSAPALAQSSSLAELARQEQERRAHITEVAASYSNADLRGGRRLTTSSSVATTVLTPVQNAADAAAPSDDTTTSAPDTNVDGAPVPEEQDEAAWRREITDARAAKDRAELMAAALQNRIDGLWAQFTARDDPIQRAQLEQDRIKAIRELDVMQKEIAEREEEIQAIQERARRNSIPPGWLR